MGAPKSRTGLLASIEVEAADWYAGLKAVRPHTAKPDQDIPILTGLHVRIDPDGNVYVMATDRYTAGIAIVSIWEDYLQGGEVVEFDLSTEDVAKIHPLFKPRKGSNPEDRLRLDIGKDTIRVTEVIGMIETEADTHHQLMRTVFVDAYPAVDKLIARCLVEAMGLRERAESSGQVGDAMAEEVVAQAAMFGRFDAAASAYGEEWAIARTREARSALLISCGESFLGILMPIKPSEDDMAKRREWQRAWVRRLPEPVAEPVTMPSPVSEDSPAEEVADIPADIPTAGQDTIPDAEVDDQDRAHPNCHGSSGHVCQKPSGVLCVEAGCDEPAGTLWTDLWCPEHDMERLDRVTAGLQSAMAQLDAEARAAGVLIVGADSLGSLSPKDLKHGAGVVFSGA